MTPGRPVVYTPLELADLLRLEGRDDRARERRVLELKNKYGWPCLKIGVVVRFTDEHVEEIIRSHTERPAAAQVQAAPMPGQTPLSAASG